MERTIEENTKQIKNNYTTLKKGKKTNRKYPIKETPVVTEMYVVDYQYFQIKFDY